MIDDMKIVDLSSDDENAKGQAASLLVKCFKDIPGVWDDMNSALQEVKESLHSRRISRIAVNKKEDVLGWISAIQEMGYGCGCVWELHPLVVSPDYQGKGIGRALVADLEQEVKKRGGLTIWLGADDHTGSTTIGGVDLYPNVLEQLSQIENLHNHPYEFYEKVGFTIVGALPDANGFGKPDVFLAKRL